MSKLFYYMIIFLNKLSILIYCQQYLIYYPTTNKQYLTKYYSLYTSKNFDPTVSDSSNDTGNFTCRNSTIDCSANGICNSTKPYDCICNKGFTTPPGNYYRCNYQNKKLLYALLLEIFPSFGFGFLYINRYEIFIAKLISF